MHNGLHHYIKRLGMKKGEPLSESFWKGVLDVAIYPVGGLSLLLTLPQVYDVWILHEVAGISLITWTMWTVSSCFWLAYGVVHKVRAVAFMQTGWITLYLLVIVGVLLYK